jgi:hypothetical protein
MLGRISLNVHRSYLKYLILLIQYDGQLLKHCNIMWIIKLQREEKLNLKSGKV